MIKAIIAAALVASVGLVAPANAQTSDISDGRRLAETACGACHQIDAATPASNPDSTAPSFVDVSRMPSTTELAIKVFLRSPHPHMPDIILSSQEIDAVAAYILSLAQK